MEQELIKILVPILVAVVGALVAWGLAELSRFVRSKTNNENAHAAMESISVIVQTTVSEMGKTFERSSEDGKLTKMEMISIKQQAIDRIKKQIPLAVDKYSKIFVEDLNEYISAKIEREIYKGNG